MLGKYLRIPRFYTAEYLLMLASSLALLFAGSVLAAMLINYWLDGGGGSVLADAAVLYVLAALITLLPVQLVLYARVRHVDRSKLTLFSQRVAALLLALYLFVALAVAVGSIVLLLALWLNAYLGAGGGADKHLWITTLSLLFAALAIKYSAWHFMRARTNLSRPLFYMLSVGIVGIGLVVPGFAYPAREYHSNAQDFVKETDLAHIQNAVNRYVDDHDALPNNLRAVEGMVKGGVANPLSDYKFEPHGSSSFGLFGYELCADFAAKSEGFNFASHKAGEQCFVRFAISQTGLEQGLLNAVQGVENGAGKLSKAIANFVGGVETDLGQQIGGLERYLEGVEAGTGQLEIEMQRLDTHVTNLTGNTAQLDQDFDDVGKFIHDLLCGLDPNCNPSNQ